MANLTPLDYNSLLQGPFQNYPSMGGNLPPELAATQIPPMGGNLPPNQVPNQAPPMGGNLPPSQSVQAPPLGGNLPPNQVPQSGAYMPEGGQGNNLPWNLGAIIGQNYVAQATNNAAPGGQYAPQQVVQDALNSLLSSDSRYIQNARLRGQEQAQNRGLLNSSIAAGAAERSAIEAAQPILNNIMNLNNQREQLGFQGEQNQLDRVQGVNNALLGAELTQRINSTQAIQQDWLNDRTFSREFNGVLSMLPISSALDLTKVISQYAVENPEVYPPSVISGLTNFFSQNIMSILQQYFPNAVQSGGNP